MPWRKEMKTQLNMTDLKYFGVKYECKAAKALFFFYVKSIFTPHCYFIPLMMNSTQDCIGEAYVSQSGKAADFKQKTPVFPRMRFVCLT